MVRTREMIAQGLSSSLTYAKMNTIFRLFSLISCFRFLLSPYLDPGEGFQWKIVMESYVTSEYPKKGFGRRDKKTVDCKPEKSWKVIIKHLQ